MQLKGLVLGWYHQGNVGDDRFAYSISHWLRDHELIFLPHTAHPPQSILETVDYVIIGGGSIANAHSGCFYQMKRWTDRAKIPIFAIGIGVSKVPELPEEFKAIEHSGGRIWVRDQGSLRNLGGDTNKITVGPDLTFLSPLPEIKDRYPSNTLVNMRPWSSLTWDAPEFATRVRNYSNSVRLSAFCDNPKHSDTDYMQEVFRELPSPFNLIQLQQARIFFTMRYHGIVFSIQTNTPFLALENSYKNKHFLNDNDLNTLEYNPAKDTSLEENIERAQSIHASGKLSAINSSLVKQAKTLGGEFKDAIVEQAHAAKKRKKPSIASKILKKVSERMLN